MIKKFLEYILVEQTGSESVLHELQQFSHLLGAQQQKQFSDSILAVMNAIQAKEIYSADYETYWKYGIIRNLERINDAIQDAEGMWGKNLDWDAVGTLSLQSIKKMEAARKKIAHEYPRAHKIAELALRLKLVGEELKGYIQKGRKPKPTDPSKFIKGMLPIEASKQAVAFLREAVGAFEGKYRAETARYYHDQFHKLKAIDLSGDATDALKKMPEALKSLASNLLVVKQPKYNGPKTAELKANAAELIEQMIDETVTMVIEGFVAKNTSKLAIIFEKKGGVSNHKLLYTRVNQMALENSMFFEFPDSSSFTIQTQVVVKRSPTGKWFAQYPTRFSDVILKDGTRMKMPSEEKMIREF
jgi:hypothetical protein